MSAVLNLESLKPAAREMAWRDAVCETFVKLDCHHVNVAPQYSQVHGRLSASIIGNLHVARVSGSAQTVIRTNQFAAQANEAFVLVSIQLHGSTIIEQEGLSAQLTPGSIGLYDTARAYQLTMPKDFDQIVLHLPRDMFEREFPGGLGCVARKVAATNPYVQAIAALAPQLSAIALGTNSVLTQRTAQTTIDLLALTLGSLIQNDTHQLDSHLPRSSISAEAIYLRCIDIIHTHLCDEDLSPAKIALLAHLSLRRLQEVFKLHGTTPSESIWDLRLEFAQQLLVSPQCQQDSVTTLAYRAGFNDVAHFSRRFRQRYHVSPSEFRSKARQ